MQVYKGTELELKSRVLGPWGPSWPRQDQRRTLAEGEDLGTIEAGKLADLILVDGIPEGHHLFQKYSEKITLIMQGALVYKNIL